MKPQLIAALTSKIAIGVAAGTLALGCTLLAMLAGGIAGGVIGEHFHWDIDHDAGA